MTKEEAENLITFDNLCICGGFAWSMNGRDPKRPHMDWCPQQTQYNEWYDALNTDAPNPKETNESNRQLARD